MPEGGSLIISTNDVYLDEISLEKRNWNLQPGIYTKISLKDTGIGMDDKTKIRIFEPYDTTKKKHSASGLGLTIVYNTIKNHTGKIDVETQLGIGTTFHIYLPSHTLYDN